MWQIIGQDRLVSLLQGALVKGTLAHAYLLVGPVHSGKMTLALDLARALNCPSPKPPCGQCPTCNKIGSGNHPDVQTVGLSLNEKSAEAKVHAEIGTEQVKQMLHAASLPPFEGKCKVFIIDGAELMSNEASNRFLKTLEEPGRNVVFVLLTSNEKALLPTVISRCQRLELRPVSVAEIEAALALKDVEPDRARLLARLAHGGIGWAFSAAEKEELLQKHTEEVDRLVEVMSADTEGRYACATELANQFGKSRGVVNDVFQVWLEYWRDLLLVKMGCGEGVANIDRMAELQATAGSLSPGQIKDCIDSLHAALEALQRNASPRLALDVLMLDMPLVKSLAVKHG